MAAASRRSSFDPLLRWDAAATIERDATTCSVDLLRRDAAATIECNWQKLKTSSRLYLLPSMIEFRDQAFDLDMKLPALLQFLQIAKFGFGEKLLG